MLSPAQEDHLRVQIFQKLITEAHRFLNRNITQRDLVLRLIAEGPITVAFVARLLGANRQTIQKIADNLVKEKICIFTDNFQHSRSKLLRLTPRGKRLLSKESKNFEFIARNATNSIGLTELRDAMRVVESLNWRTYKFD
jgi:DNA-binding MarR family transcriptional regulator